jgi:hypothetical protein
MADPSLNTVSQFAHVGVAYSVTLSLLIVLGLPMLWWYLPVAIGLAAGKEFWYDYKYETPDVRGSSLEDFMYYVSGILAALTFFVATS